MTSLASNALRSRTAVREAIDAKLGRGDGLGVDDAWSRLSPVERVEWTLGELLVLLLDHRFHVWTQSFALPGTADWPTRIEALAQMGRPLGDEVADLLRWTAARARRVRDGERDGEPLVGVVPWVWEAAWDPVPEWAYALVERWPEGLDIDAVDVRSWERPLTPPSPASPAYPSVHVTVGSPNATVPDAVLSCSALIRAAVVGLWRAGAPDATLDEAFSDLGCVSDVLPERLARWVHLDGMDADTLRARLDPVARELGITSSSGLLAVVVPPQRLQGIHDAIQGAWFMASQDSFRSRIRVALRSDPSLLLVDATALTAADADLIFQTAISGYTWVFGGTNEVVEGVLVQLQPLGFRIERT